MTPPVVARFTVEGEPASKSRARFTKRGSKTVAYTPEKTKQAEERVAWAYRKAGGKVHDGDTGRAYGVSATFHYAHNQRRDVDNMLKLILDGLNKIAWPDDVQVVELIGRKQFTENDPRTEVTIYALGRMGRPEKACEHCGTTFQVYRSTKQVQRFCGRACMAAFRAAQRTRTCQHCAKSFQAWGASRKTKFCSEACESDHARVDLTCIRCGSTYSRARSLANRGRHLCSDQCRAAWWREQRKGAAKGTCARCGGPTSKKTYTHCRVCAPRARAGGAA